MREGQIITEKKEGKHINPNPLNRYLRLNSFFGYAEWHPFKGQKIEVAPRVLLNEM